MYLDLSSYFGCYSYNVCVCVYIYIYIYISTHSEGVRGKLSSKLCKNENNTEISLYQLYLPKSMKIS